MFARRRKPSTLSKARDFFWPRIGFRRSLVYIGHRLARLPGTPYTIAGGFAWGAAVSFTPFVGFHFILAGIFAWLTRCGIIASAIGTAVGNPWTFPFIWTLIYQVGSRILGHSGKVRTPPLDNLREFFSELWALIGNWLQCLFGLKNVDEFTSTAAWDHIALLDETVFLPMLAGSLPVGIAVWIVFFLPLNYLVKGYQHNRRHRLHRAQEKRAAKLAGKTNAHV